MIQDVLVVVDNAYFATALALTEALVISVGSFVSSASIGVVHRTSIRGLDGLARGRRTGLLQAVSLLAAIGHSREISQAARK